MRASSPSARRASRGARHRAPQKPTDPPKHRSGNLGALPSEGGAARSAARLPRVSPLPSTSTDDFRVSRSLNKCTALPAVCTMPRSPPAQPRQLAELPNTSATRRSPPQSPTEPPDEPYDFSTSHRLHLPPDTVAVVLLASAGSSTANFSSNAYLSFTDNASRLDQVEQNTPADSVGPFNPQPPPTLPSSPLPRTRADRQRRPLSNSPSQFSLLPRVESGCVLYAVAGAPGPLGEGPQEEKGGADDTSSKSHLPPPNTLLLAPHVVAEVVAPSPPSPPLQQNTPHHRAYTRAGTGGALSDDSETKDGFSAVVNATVPHTAAAAAAVPVAAHAPAPPPHPQRQQPFRLSDLSDAPSRVTLTSSMRILSEFLKQHTPQKTLVTPAGATGDTDGTTNVTAKPCITFSEAEKKEIGRLITELQDVVSPVTTSPPASPTGLIAPLVPTSPTTIASATAPAAAAQPIATEATRPPKDAAVAGADAAAAARRPVAPELTLAHAKIIRPMTGLTSASPAAAAAATGGNKRRSRSIIQKDPSATDEPQSVEGRYHEALKTIEDAAADCQVALKRVQDYSESLYVLVQTWMHLYDNRFDEFARAVLLRMLDNNPSYRVLFHQVNVQRQALVIMDMIGRAVVAFTRPADLMDIMGEVGARHNLYGVTENHFISMREAFLQVYSEFVGAETFAKSVGVWKMFWKTTIELAVSGSTTERGTLYARRRYRIWAGRVHKAVKALLPLQRIGGFHRLMHTGYTKAVERHPELAKYSQMSDPRTAHRCMEIFLRITKRVVNAESALVIEYNDQFSVEHLFTNLAESISVEDMKKIEEPFLEACESYLKPANAWTDVVRVCIRELWSTYITGYWIAKPSKGEDTAHGGTAPDGKEPFCLMFTDIEASTRLWDRETKPMATAINQHHQVIRGLIEDFGGYEVKTVGDSFLIATRNVTQALLIAFGIQLELMTGPSAPGFRMVDDPQGAGAASCWRDDALRVRVGIHYCTDASAVYDSVHNRFDYYGPSVNCAARVEAAACGGQVLMSQAAYEHLCAEDGYAKSPLSSLFAEQLGKLALAQEARGFSQHHPDLAWVAGSALKHQHGKSTISFAQEHGVGGDGDVEQRLNAQGNVMTLQSLTTITDEGLHPLKGIAEPVQLFSLLPLGLTARTFPNNRLTNLASLERSTGSSFSLELSSSVTPSLPSEMAMTEGFALVAADFGFS